MPEDFMSEHSKNLPAPVLAGPYESDLLARFQRVIHARCDHLKLSITGPIEGSAPELTYVNDTTRGERSFALRLQSMLRHRSELPLPVVAMTGREAVMAELLWQNYPAPMQHFADEVRIAEALQKRSAPDLSFLVLGQDDASGRARYAAGCLAYVTTSRLSSRQEVVFLDGVVVDDVEQGRLGGPRVLREFLARTAMYGYNIVELRARQKTAYRGFQAGSAGKRLLESSGWTVRDHGLSVSFGQGSQREDLYLIELRQNEQ